MSRTSYLLLFPSCSYQGYKNQGMSCKGACVHAHVRCAVAHVCVRPKSFLERVGDVRACGLFLGMRCVTLFLLTFGTNLP